jgi:tRNA(Ile)-lysidine synthase
MDLRQQVLMFIRKENMMQKGDHILAGVSGGADSVCLLVLLHSLMDELSFKLSVLHVNHGIRQEASEDADYVKTLCDNYKVPFYLEEIDVPSMTRELSIGEEEAGRLARYDLFYKKMDEIGAGKLAVAHNMNDQAETFIMNLARGSGLRGLSGIRAVRDKIIRPLLMTSREDIEAYLQDQNILFKTDATNLEDDHTRNRIRHHILPYMTRNINSETLSHISRAAAELSYAQEYIESQAAKWLEDNGFGMDKDLEFNKNAGYDEGMHRSYRLSLQGYTSQPYIIRKYIIMKLLDLVTMHRKDITQAHIEAADRLCMDKAGSKKLNLPYGIRLIRSYDELEIALGRDAVIDDDELVVDLEAINKADNGYIFSFNNTDFRARIIEIQEDDTEDFISKVPRLPYTKWFDYDKILSCPTFRFRRAGDYIVIDKEGHKKSLKKFMTDAKIPENKRNSVILMADGDSIMWVLGYRTSCAYEISASTKHILEIDALSVI